MLQPYQQQAEKLEKTGEVVGSRSSECCAGAAGAELVRGADAWRGHVDRHTAGGVVRPLSGVLSADLAQPCAFGHGDAVSLASPEHGVCDAGPDREDAAELHCGEPADRTADFGVSVAIFGLLHVPFFYFVGFLSGFLSLVPYLGIVLAMVPPILVGLGQLEPGDLVIVVLCVVGAAPVRAECSVSEAAGEPAEDQSVGGHDRAAVLGSGVGSGRVGAGDSDHGGDQDRLRPRGVDEAVCGLAGRVEDISPPDTEGAERNPGASNIWTQPVTLPLCPNRKAL